MHTMFDTLSMRLSSSNQYGFLFVSMLVVYTTTKGGCFARPLLCWFVTLFLLVVESNVQDCTEYDCDAAIYCNNHDTINFIC